MFDIDSLIKYFKTPVGFDMFSKIITNVLPDHVKLIWGADVPYKKYFDTWQKSGVSILPNHYYSPIPNLSDLNAEKYNVNMSLVGIDFEDDFYIQLLGQLSLYKDELKFFSQRDKNLSDGKWFSGGPFARPDVDCTYSIVRNLKPARIIEIGSGFSTLVISEACIVNSSLGYPVTFTSVDPYPSYVLDYKPKGLSNHIPEPLENIDHSIFSQLNENDILFIDSSHVFRPNGDVDIEFFNIIPSLNKGVWIHVHDIFLPKHYPLQWLKEEHIFWNEQYILAAFLMFNKDFKITLPLSYLCHKYPAHIINAFPLTSDKLSAGSFWFKRV